MDTLLGDHFHVRCEGLALHRRVQIEDWIIVLEVSEEGLQDFEKVPQ